MRVLAFGSLQTSLRFILLGIAAAIAVPVAHARDPMPPAGERVLAIYLDEARILGGPERTATVVVGNPLIADAAVQPGGIAVITGKGYGGTNVVALDRSGVILVEHQIQVLGPRDYTVVLYRGIERETYSCAPTCERRITLGDSAAFFNLNLLQAGNRNTLAQAGGQR